MVGKCHSDVYKVPAVNRGLTQQTVALTVSVTVQRGSSWGSATPGATGFYLERYRLLRNLSAQLSCLYLHILYLPSRAQHRAQHTVGAQSGGTVRGCPGGGVSIPGCLPESRGLGITLADPRAWPQTSPSAL